MRKGIILAAALTVVSSAACWIALAQDSKDAGDAPKAIEIISAKKYEFSPSEIHVRVGTKVTLKVHSEDETHGVKVNERPEGTNDKAAPGLVFDEPNENGKVTKHEDQVVTFIAREPGTYEFKCAKVCGFGHGRMKGTIIVEP